jgi:prevent-host-death family protein
MHTWQVQNAKARFNELLEACITEGPQLVTKHGAETAVLVPIEMWRKLQTTAKPTLKELLLSDENRGDLILPVRGQQKCRTVQPME